MSMNKKSFKNQLSEAVQKTDGILTDIDSILSGETGVTICGANVSSPVTDEAYYIDEISYRIGNRKYTENAP